MKLIAIKNKVILKKLPSPTMAGAIILPENMKSREKSFEYEVLSIGSIAAKNYPELEIGQIVLANKFGATNEGLEDEICSMDADAIGCIM